MMPTIKIATISKVVATGRRMKMRDGFMRRGARGAAPSWGRRGFRSTVARVFLAGGLPAGPRMHGRGAWQQYFRTVAQTIAAFRDDRIPGRQSLGDGDPFAVDRTGRHRSHRDGIIRVHQIDEVRQYAVRRALMYRCARYRDLIVEQFLQ